MKAVFLLPLLACGPVLAAPAKVALGDYECWAHNQPRMLLNFSVKSNGSYVGSDGKAGKFAYDAASGRLEFTSGANSGVMPNGFTSVYHEPKGRPTLSFRSGRGAEAAFCEKTGK